MKAAFVQMKCEKGLIEKNLRAMEEYVLQGYKNGAKLFCFPEMCVTGYINPEKQHDAVITLDSLPVKRVVDMSGKYETVITAGFVEKNGNNKPYITQIAAAEGKLIGYYRKRTIVDEEALWFSPGSENFYFTYSGLNFGLAICADIDSFGLFKEYGENGTEIVLHSAAPGLYGEQSTRNWKSGYDWWKGECFSKLARYAKDYHLIIGVSTQAGRTVDEDFSGGGYIFSQEGKCICETPDWNEGILYGYFSK